MSNENPGVGGAVPEPHVGSDGPRPATPGQLPPPHHGAAPQQPVAPGHFAPPQHAGGFEQGPAPQHGGTVEHGAAPQHAGTAHQGPAPQQAGTAHQGPAPQHGGTPLQGPHTSGAQAVQHAGHYPPPDGAQHLPGAGGGPEPAAAQHAAPHIRSGRWRQVKNLRHARPRLFMGVVGGAAAAAVAVGALAVRAAQDDPKPHTAVAAETSVPAPATTVPASAVPTTRPAPPATTRITAPPATHAPTTTEAATTTTVAALPSGAGDYNVSFGDITISSTGFSTSVPGQAQQWSFTGPCDGVGDCSISAAGEAVLSTTAVGSIFSGPGAAVTLVPAGNGSYTSTFTFGAAECGSGTGNLSITVIGGALTGHYDASIPAASSCPVTNISASFTGIRA